jgi:hypothetical protein
MFRMAREDGRKRPYHARPILALYILGQRAGTFPVAPPWVCGPGAPWPSGARHTWVAPLELGIGPEVLTLEEAQFVAQLEVRGAQPRITLEPDDLHSGLAELGRQHRAGRPTPTMTPSVSSVAMAHVLPSALLLLPPALARQLTLH